MPARVDVLFAPRPALALLLPQQISSRSRSPSLTFRVPFQRRSLPLCTSFRNRNFVRRSVGLFEYPS
mgnify:CR=1